MIGIVIVAHGGLAREYLAAVEHVVGKQSGIRAISIEYDHNRAAKQAEICAAADSVDRGDGVVVVTDMWGGSPSNLSLPACCADDRRILYGANLPMLIKLAKSRRLSVPDAAAAALEAGRKYINSYENSGGERSVSAEKVLKIVNEKGLHARASAKFVEVVEAHDARAEVEKDGMRVSGDSIMGLLMLAASRGTEIRVRTDGAQADALLAALAKLVANRFGEPF